jgi:hypothetical protein
MLKSYEAIYENGQINWVNDKPSVSKAKVIVVVEEDQDDQWDTVPNGTGLAEILDRIAATCDVASSFGDPIKWQQETRQDRPLHGRNDG